MERSPLISIISVALNCRDDVRATIESLMAQTFHNYEYVVIDGQSTDGTLEIVREYETDHDNITVISELDKGIYDAMNKGVRNSAGKYVYFLNMGDCFQDESVLQEVSNYLSTGDDIYYGDVMKAGVLEQAPRKVSMGRLVYREKMICHQSIFASRSLCLENPFDIQFKICADRAWLIASLKKGASCIYMAGLTVADYDVSGQSADVIKFKADSLAVTCKYGGAFVVLFVRMKRKLGELWK